MRVSVPKEFQPSATSSYPSYCTSEMVEQYFAKHYKGDHERIYLPVLWTNYYCQKDYGKGNIRPLFDWLDSLDKSKKYFTIIQYDDGIIEKPDGLDILGFSSGHGSGIPIPLVPSHYLDVPIVEKVYDLSFCGNLTTHPIRKQLIDETGCWVSYNRRSDEYYQFLSQSEFTLCPRGYGITSFRLYEALHCGTVPIYVSDVHWLPASRSIDWSKIAILVRPNEINTIRYKMTQHVQDWDYYDSIKELFTMQGIFDYIVGFLEGEQKLRNELCSVSE